MNQKDSKFHEMAQAAMEAGLPEISDQELGELESLWSDLDLALKPPRQAPDHQPEVPQQSVREWDREVVSPVRWKNIATVFTGIAAAMALAFLIVQSVLMRQTLQRQQDQIRQLESSLVLTSIKSPSPVERMDSLLKLTEMDSADPVALGAAIDRLTSDEDTHVRMASLELLSQYADRPDVVDILVNAARNERSPIVALHILEILLRNDPSRSEQLWRELQTDPRFVDVVGSPTSSATTSTTNL